MDGRSLQYCGTHVSWAATKRSWAHHVTRCLWSALVWSATGTSLTLGTGAVLQDSYSTQYSMQCSTVRLQTSIWLTIFISPVTFLLLARPTPPAAAAQLSELRNFLGSSGYLFRRCVPPTFSGITFLRDSVSQISAIGSPETNLTSTQIIMKALWADGLSQQSERAAWKLASVKREARAAVRNGRIPPSSGVFENWRAHFTVDRVKIKWGSKVIEKNSVWLTVI